MTSEAEKARAAAMQFEAKKHELRQLQNGEWKITFSIHPDEMPDPIMRAGMGTRYQVVAVELSDDETPVQHEGNGKSKRKWKDLKPSQQAGMLCEHEAFWTFLSESGMARVKIVDPQQAAATIRYACCVSSRSEFDTDKDAASCWAQINHEYETWLKTPDL